MNIFSFFCCHSRSVSCTRTDGQSLVLLYHIFDSPVLKAGQELFHYTWIGCWQCSVLNPSIQHISEGRFHSLASPLQCKESHHTPEAFILNSVPGATDRHLTFLWAHRAIGRFRTSAICSDKAKLECQFDLLVNYQHSAFFFSWSFVHTDLQKLPSYSFISSSQQHNE